MKPPLRIAILQCDTPLAGTQAKYGDYGGVFKALLEAAADALQSPDISSKKGMQLTKWHVQKDETDYPALDDIDAVLITGSSMDEIAAIVFGRAKALLTCLFRI
jgi:hypothetical protein